ncbi:MAG: addiction module protein [Planctomycetes bacterium]|nr:addiction module protein [Planctomycetota bacterium]
MLEAAKALPLGERIHLAQSLWESLVEHGYEPDLSPRQAIAIDRRLKEHRENPDDVVPWEAIQAELDKRLGKRG